MAMKEVDRGHGFIENDEEGLTFEDHQDEKRGGD